MAEILVIVVNYQTAELAERCLQAVARERATGLNLSAIVVDGCSSDGSVARLRSFINESGIGSWAELLPLNFNGGFGWANNQALLHRAEQVPQYIYFLNPDTEVGPGAISALTQILREREEVAAVGSQLIEESGNPSASAFSFPSIGKEFVRGSQTFSLGRLLGLRPSVTELENAGPVDWVSGASVLIRKDALQQTGLFDHGFFLYFEEVELMHRLKSLGWQIWLEPRSRVRHVGGAATGIEETYTRRVKPSYWFDSRLRYFALTGGRFRAFLANMAWLTGYCIIGLPRLIVSPSSRKRTFPGELRGIVAAGLFPQPDDYSPQIPTFLSASNTMPFWTHR